MQRYREDTGYERIEMFGNRTIHYNPKIGTVVPVGANVHDLGEPGKKGTCSIFHRGVLKDKLTQYLRAFQIRRELFRKPDKEALKHAIRATL